MGDFYTVTAYLPPNIRDVLRSLPVAVQERVQEIRLRRGAPVVLSTPQGEQTVTVLGTVNAGGKEEKVVSGKIGTTFGETVKNGWEIPQRFAAPLLCCSQQQLSDVFEAACDDSVHTHQSELCNGYITTKDGCRIGVAGTVVTEHGQVQTIRQLTSLCLRISRPHPGCARGLAAALTADGHVHSALLCGAPASGKTSLLRDLCRQLANGETGRRYRVSVVDERGELGAGTGLSDCDVLLNCPKAIGIGQAVRCLAPDVVVFDELGTEEEMRQVTAGLNAGVAAIASVHADSLASLRARPALKAALDSGTFDYIVLLKGRTAPGQVDHILKIGGTSVEDHRTLPIGGDRRPARSIRGRNAAPAGEGTGAVDTAGKTNGRSNTLYISAGC